MAIKWTERSVEDTLPRWPDNVPGPRTQAHASQDFGRAHQMPDEMPDEMPEEMPEEMREEMPAEMPEDGAPRALVRIEPEVEAEVIAHLEAHAVEQGGLLLGIPWVDADDRLVCIDVLGQVPALQSEGSAVSLQMDAAVWRDAAIALQGIEASGRPEHRALAAEFPRILRVVGWYHSHPGLGAFFSGTDRDTQRAFFRQRFSIGWVIDPIQREEALFIGPDSAPALRITD